MSNFVVKLNAVTAVSDPELRRNNDIDVSANFGAATTVSVRVDHPFKIQRYMDLPVQVDDKGVVYPDRA